MRLHLSRAPRKIVLVDLFRILRLRLLSSILGAGLGRLSFEFFGDLVLIVRLRSGFGLF